MPRNVLFSGLRVRSELELPEFEPGPETSVPPDVRIELCPVPEELSGSALIEDEFQVEPARVLYRVPGVAAYLIEAGERIAIEPAPGATAYDVRGWLLSGAWNVLCLQRGLVPLHASALLAADGAVALIGRSGAGKSTLAAALAQRGHRCIAEDVLIVRPGAAGPALASPHLQEFRLWPDSRLALGLPLVRRAWGQREKDVVIPTIRIPATSAPLRRIYHLVEGDPGGPIAFSRIGGRAAAVALFESTCGFAMLGAMARRREHFELCASILRHAEIFTFCRPKDLARLRDVLDALEAHLGEGLA